MFHPTTVTLVRALIVITLSAAALLATGCSGSDNADVSTTVATVATTDAPTTTARPSTTTSTTSTTATPTTTIDPTAQLIADIEADLNAGEQALLAAGADPSNPALRADVNRFFTARSLDRVNDFLDQLVAGGLQTRANPLTPNLNVVLELIDQAESSATVAFCRIDSTIVYQELPGGTEAIVDDRVVRYDTRARFTLQQGVWVTDGEGEVINEQSGVQSCD